MPFTGVANTNSKNITTTKCGEIVITIKRKTKNIYSFNCCFCDTICLQMKKFTLHLEQEHIRQLELATSDASTEDDKTEIQAVPVADNILLGEIKIEDCTNDDIKSETGDENSRVLATNKKDPLETFEDNNNELSLPLRLEYNETSASNEHLNMYRYNDSEDVEMYNFSDEQHEDQSDLSGEDYASETDLKKDNSLDGKAAAGRAKAQDKELTLALIVEYHKNPQLWNTTLAAKCNIQQKEYLLQSITDHLNAKLKMDLKLQMVKKKLNIICKQYEREIERQLNENEKTTNSDLWFYEYMSFLKDITENKLKLKKRKPKLKVDGKIRLTPAEKQKRYREKLKLDKARHTEFLVKQKERNAKRLKRSEMYGWMLMSEREKHKFYQRKRRTLEKEGLWDVNHLAYTVKEKRHEIMQSMLGELKNKVNISLDMYRLEKHLNYIHKSFAKDKQHRLECEVKQEDFQPSCSYFKKCDFLEAHQGPFKCSNCRDIIETYNDYQIHKSLHEDSMPFKCQECGMGFKKISNYTIHAKRHLRVFKFHCEICGKGYPFNAELDLHMRSHTGAQPYLCSVCGEGFRTAISYDNHIRRHEERFKYFCHICKKGFNHMTRLNDHVKAHLNVRDVICTVCGKGFTSRKYLNHHKRIHEGKNYSCNICGKSFAQDAGLRAHKKYHGTPIGISSIQKRTKEI